MGPAKETAEEQLLRMIEGPTRPGPGRGGPRRPGLAALREQVRGRVGVFADWIAAANRPGHPGDTFLTRLRMADRLLWVALFLLGLYAAMDLVFYAPRLPVLRSQQPSAADAAPAAVAAVDARLQPVTAYQEQITSRNPFQLAAKRTAEALTETSRDRLVGLIKPLQVVGINRGANAEALVEDATTSRTHFVRVGDTINGLTVKAIDAQGVLVEYQGEEIRLE